MSSTDSGKQMSENKADGASFSSASSPNNVPAIMPSERDATHYNMDHKYRGIALIFNHERFEEKSMNREGTNKDADSLKDMLTELGFHVKIKKDNKLFTMQKNINEVSKFDHTDYDCFVMVVLTHGKSQDMLCAKDKIYHSDDLWKNFTADKCPSLAGKPKLFIIQACRGDKRMSSATSNPTEADEPLNTIYKIPSHADFLFAYSTIPGYISLRNHETGSWFIEALCKEFKSNKYNYDILSLLTFVIRRVAVDYEGYITEYPDQGKQKQIPSLTTTLTRLVQFTKKRKTNTVSEEYQALDELLLPGVIEMMECDATADDVVGQSRTLFDDE